MILFYVSGHGYGHATRTNAVVQALLRQQPDAELTVRTTAPEFLFDRRVRYTQAYVEPAIVEHAGALGVDMEASAQSVREFLRKLPDVVRRESAFVREHGVKLVAGDIPFSAGLIASAAGVPSLAMGNFLWSWILDGCGVSGDVLEAYGQFDLAVRYPLSHKDGWEVFSEVRDVALVAPRSTRDRDDIRRELRVHAADYLVVIGGRAPLDGAATERLRRECADFRFFRGDALPCYHDLVRAADVVVSKAGYSIAAECIAEQSALVYPRRTGFREDGMLLPQLHRFGRALEIPTKEWASGHWRPWLEEALALPRPAESLGIEGAEECARIVCELAKQQQ